MKNRLNWIALATALAVCLMLAAALLRPASPVFLEAKGALLPEPRAETVGTFLTGSPSPENPGRPRLAPPRRGQDSSPDEASLVAGDAAPTRPIPELLGSWRSALSVGGSDLAQLYLSIQQGLETTHGAAETETTALVSALSEGEIPLGERGHLASLVGESTSAAGTAALLDLASVEDEELASLAWQGLETVGLRPERNLDQSEEVADLLEARFHELRGVEGIGAGAVALAQLGTPRAVEFLLDFYAQPHSEEMVGALNRAFSRVRNPEAVDVLGEHLRRGDLDDPRAEVSGFALANMSSARASGVLGEWAIQAKDEDAPYAAYLFQLASRGEGSLQMLTSYADFEIFGSDAVKRELEAIIRQLKVARGGD